MSQNNLHQALQRAMQLARAGDRAAARLAFIDALRIDSHSEVALLGLVSVTHEPKERMAALRKACLMYPDSPRVAEALRRLNLTAEQVVGTTTRSLAASASRPATAELEQLRPATSDLTPAAGLEVQPPAPRPLKPLGATAQPLTGLIPPAEAAADEAVPTPEPEAAEPAIDLGQAIASLMRPIPGDSGVPVPNRAALQAAMQSAAALTARYDSERPASALRFARRAKHRAGERDRRVFQARVAVATSAAVFVVALVTLTAALNNPDVQRIVFAPTWTPSPTATSSATPTPGTTPTPSPTPRQSPTPSPTFPPLLPVRDPSIPPRPTEVNAPAGVLIEPRIAEAVALINAGRLDAARALLDEEKRSAELTGNFLPYYYAALLEVQRGNLDEAQRIVERGDELWQERSNIEVLQPMVDVAYARVLIARGAAAEAALREIDERLTAALSFDTQFIATYLAMADRYLLVNDRDEALRVLEEALAVNPTSVELRAKQAEVLLLLRREREALQALHDALLLDPFSERALQLQVQAAIALGDPGLAVLYAEQYMARYPGRVLPILLRAEARLAEEKPDLALADLTRALNGNPQEAAFFDVLLLRADLHQRARRFDLARQDLDRALTLRDDPRLRVRRMEIAFASGDLDTALADARQLAAGDNPPPEAALYENAVLLRRGEEAPGAPQALQPVLDDVRGETRSLAFETLARAYLAAGDTSAALDMANTALRSHPTLERRLLRARIYEERARSAPDLTTADRTFLRQQALADYEWVAAFSPYFPQVDRAALQDAIDRLRQALD